MNLYFRKILLCYFLSFGAAFTYGQVNFSTIISPGQINENEYTTFRIIIENGTDIQRVDPPLFKNFVIIRGPVREWGEHIVSGHKTKYIAWAFVIKPKKAGHLKIESATATIKGKVYKSNPVSLLVKNIGSPVLTQPNPFAIIDPIQHQRPRSDFNDYIFHKEDNVADKINKNMFLRLEVDKTICFVGEPIVASYNLYSRLKSESKLIRNPSFNGFSVIDLQKPEISDPERQKFNGREYNVYTLRKAQLYPLQPDTIGLEPAELENDVQFIKENYAARISDLSSVFDDFLLSSVPTDAIINQNVILKSEPVNIIVKPLPEKGKPVSFKGAVGNFSISGSLQKNKFSTDEAGKLTLTVSGTGNMQLLTLPDIEWPFGIEFFDAKVLDNLNVLTIPVSGDKTFEFSFSGNAPGNYKLPPVSFSYFDPKTANYRTIQTAPLLFTVVKGTANPAATSTKISVRDKNGPLITEIFNHRWWVILFIAIVILMGIILWLLHEKNSDARQVSMPNVSVQNDLVMLSAFNQQNPLTKTEKCLQSDECFEFYAVLNTELKHYLSHKFLIDSNDINSITLTEVMDRKGIPNDIILQLQSIMQDVEWQLYTPFERNKKMHELYHAALDIIQEINAYDIKHR